MLKVLIDCFFISNVIRTFKMSGQMPQGHFAGNRPYNNQMPQQQQQQQQNYNMNRISSPHQGIATSDDLAGHNQGSYVE